MHVVDALLAPPCPRDLISAVFTALLNVGWICTVRVRSCSGAGTFGCKETNSFCSLPP